MILASATWARRAATSPRYPAGGGPVTAGTRSKVGKRWVAEGTNSWMNGDGKIRRCIDRNGTIIDFYLYLAAPIHQHRLAG